MNYKDLFPMFKNNPGIVYFDNSALTFKPQTVINSGIDFYEKYSISTRTADSVLGIQTEEVMHETRKKIADLIDASADQTIFTSGTTDGLNLISLMLKDIIKDGEIIFSYFNHSSAIVPFIENLKNNNITFKYAKDNEEVLDLINEKTRLIVLPQLTNNFNVFFDLKKIHQKSKKYGAYLINDAAQAIAHEKVSLNDCDVIVFSSNKIYGPTGMGALVIEKDLLKKIVPQKWGGGQVQSIGSGCEWSAKNDIKKFEPGTPNFAGIFQFNAAIDFINSLGYELINKLETAIANYCYDELKTIDGIEIDSKRGDKIILFNIKNIPSQDIASYLGHNNIYVRSGVFCAHKFHELKQYSNSYVRISISFYNDYNDVDKFIKLLKEMGANFLEFL